MNSDLMAFAIVGVFLLALAAAAYAQHTAAYDAYEALKKSEEKDHALPTYVKSKSR